MVFIILMTTQVIVFCLMLFVYLRSRLHGGSDKYLNTLIFCFILLTVTLIITQSPAPRLWGCAPISSKSPKFTRSPLISRATDDM
ncbi:hypothetical protein [Providencia rettgeri]|uniref:hypothetical protein n=1 Tax=Providencia rettgeri TaxID=587 RepID=UPI0024BAA059|nr:hypothetical protein [Providencia rettgeri]WJM88545.1 hypothetical protein KOL64_22175 [Providencia rettgeri]